MAAANPNRRTMPPDNAFTRARRNVHKSVLFKAASTSALSPDPDDPLSQPAYVTTSSARIRGGAVKD